MTYRSPGLVALYFVIIPSLLQSQNETVTRSEYRDGMMIETTVNNTWNRKANASMEKIYTGAWEFHNVSAGESHVIRLHRSDFLLGSSDGASSHEIVFQLPPTMEEGHTYPLKSIPLLRTPKIDPDNRKVALMKDGEIVASRYSNPLAGWMKHSQSAHVKIIRIEKTQLQIHLTLKAKLKPELDFDLDEEFTVGLSRPKEK